MNVAIAGAHGQIALRLARLLAAEGDRVIGLIRNPDHALLQRLSGLRLPVFVANGDSDPMILPHYSYLLAGLIPQARVKIYPDSAHGFLFQHHAEFAADVEAFLQD